MNIVEIHKSSKPRFLAGTFAALCVFLEVASKELLVLLLQLHH